MEEILKDAPEEEELEDIPPPFKTNELHIWDETISKLYTDDCGRFPIRSRIGNEYIMITYHCDSNNILKETCTNRKNKQSILVYNSTMKRLADRGHKFDVQILDNEVSAEYKRVMVDNWGATYQLVPSNVHQNNIAERSIHTFKANFYQSWKE